MADTTIDSLQIEINAKAQTANDAIDALADKLDILSNSLGKLNNVRLDNFFNSLKGFQGSKLPDFARLANGISKLSNINYNEILNAGQSLRQIASQLQSLGGIKLDDNVVQIANVANAMSKLGGKSIINATNNVPLLANALNQLMVTLSKAPTVNQSVIDMTNALANLAAQGSKVGSASKSVVNGLNRTNAAAKRASGSTMSLARAFGKFYANYFLLVRGFKGMFNMMESAMELTETVNYFERTLEDIGEKSLEHWEDNGTQSAKEYAESFAKQLRESTEKLTGFVVDEEGQISQSTFSGLGLNPATTTQYSAMFAQVANSIGMTAQASTDLSEAFIRLGADWASLRNVDFEVAYEKLASGLAGQSRALRAFGIDITMATLQEIAFANGIEKSVSEMTQSEKAYLRLIAIIEQSEVAFGDLANTLASPANQMRMLSQGVQNLGTLIGNLFLPILSKTLPVLNGFVIAMQRIVIAISEAMGIDTSGFNTSLGGMDESFSDLSDSVDEATESAEKFNRATRGWDELNVLGKDNARGYGVGNDLVENEQLLDAYNDAIEKYRKAWNDAYKNINNEAEDFADGLLRKLNVDKIADNFKLLATSVKEIGEAFLPLLGGFGTGFAESSINVVGTFLQTISGFLQNIKPEDAYKLGEALGKIATNVLLFKGGVNVANGISNAVNAISKIGGAIKANPILLVAGAGAVVATNLASLLANYTNEAFSYDIMDEWEGFADEIDAQTESFKERAEAAKKASEMPSELESVYERWKKIANKVGELSDEDSGLLVQYANRIKELMPDATKYIGENGLAYEGVADELDNLINKQLELYRVQSMETYVKDIMKLEIEAEYNLKDLRKEQTKLFEDIVEELAPETDITQNPLYGLLPEVEFQNVVLEDIKEAYKKRLNDTKVSLFNTEELKNVRSEYENAVKEIENYQSVQQEISEQEELHKELQSQLKEAISSLTDAQKVYRGETESASDSTESLTIDIEGLRKELDNSVSSMYDVNKETKEATKTIDIFASSTVNAKKSFSDLLDTVSGFSTKSITLPTIESIQSKLTLPSDVISRANSSINKSSAVNDLIDRAIRQNEIKNTVDVTFEVQGDPNGLFTVIQKQANQYTKSTGKTAFGY